MDCFNKTNLRTAVNENFQRSAFCYIYPKMNHHCYSIPFPLDCFCP